MSTQESEEVTGNASGQERVEHERAAPNDSQQWESHFWASSFPFFKSSLFISPASFAQNSDQDSSDVVDQDSSPSHDKGAKSEVKLDSGSALSVVDSQVQIFDADGELINDISVQSVADDITVLELDQFLGAAKLEGGQKHVHVKVVSFAPAFHMCRLHTSKGASILGEPISLTVDHSVFFPVRIGEERQNMLTVINHHDSASNVKCRLFMGARTPEFYFSIPGNGSRIFSVESEFADHLEGIEGHRQSYLRLSTKSKGTLGVQLVERVGNDREIGMYTSVS